MERGGAIVLMSAALMGKDSNAELVRIYVLQVYQGRGFGVGAALPLEYEA